MGSDNMDTLCHCVLSCLSPELLSFQFSEVAIGKLQTLPPLGKVWISGSFPKLPSIITLLMLQA